MIERLFVYGSLAPGKSNEQLLRDVPGTWSTASVRGYLVDEGWGAAAGYPGIVLDREAGEVRGFVLTSDALSSRWCRLDAFEGDDYERVATEAILDIGVPVSAYVYTLRRR